MKLDFAITEADHEAAMHLLFGPEWLRPQDPELGFLAELYTATGEGRRTLILGEIIKPEPGEVRWSASQGLVMAHSYYSRAIDRLQDVPGAGLLNVHSHPGPRTGLAPPVPSQQDLTSDRIELLAASRALPADRPVAAAIFSAGGGISVREYSFKRPVTTRLALRYERMGPNVQFADRVRIVGRRLRFQQGDPNRSAPPRSFDPVSTDSSILLWGERGQKLLAEIAIGIAGLGGVGGMVAEYLARLGVGRIVLVDYDRLKLENFNRSHGATRREATNEVPKVQVYSRVVKAAATAPKFQVVSKRMSVAEESGIRQLLGCDLLIGSADDAFARQVLDHAAYAHLIPVIDGGTTLLPQSSSFSTTVGKCQVVSAGPGHPCLECQGVYTQEEATVARERASWGKYLDVCSVPEDIKNELRAPSVICANSLVASLIVLRVLSIALGITPATTCGLQRYYIESGELQWGAIKACKPDCRKPSFTRKGDAHCLATGTDLRWKSIQEEEKRLRSAE
jgi:molybdopterin/thiamine biosynthesis adenylyltransferase